jgi:hypothetical protein
MAIRCIVKDCPSVSEAAHQPETGWALLQLSQIAGGGVLTTAGYGSMCPACVAELELRSPNEQLVKQPDPPTEPEPAPAPDVETKTEG